MPDPILMINRRVSAHQMDEIQAVLDRLWPGEQWTIVFGSKVPVTMMGPSEWKAENESGSWALDD